MTSTSSASLSSLCSSCHAAPPQYRCPRCGTRTCSLACSRLHKARTLCSGVRDPSAFATRAQLNTPAAFDRDFNFISGVERGIERAARDADARGIDIHKSSRGLPMDSSGSRGGFNRRGGRAGGKAGERPERGQVPFMKSCASDGITVIRAPKGLTREKENRTHWRRKGGGVSWTIEWHEITSNAAPSGGSSSTSTSKPYRRGLTQLHDSLTVKEGFTGWQSSLAGAKRKREGYQPPGDVAEDSNKRPIGNSKALPNQTNAGDGLHADGAESVCQFALDAVDKQAEPGTKVLIPFDPSLRLKQLLRGQTVREYPTIYVWRGKELSDAGSNFSFLERIDSASVETEDAARLSRGQTTDESRTENPQFPATNQPAEGITNLESNGGEVNKESSTEPAAGDRFHDEEHEEGQEAEEEEEEQEEEEKEEGEEPGGQDTNNVETAVHVPADSMVGIGGAIVAALSRDHGLGG